jgi:hypothetical protein
MDRLFRIGAVYGSYFTTHDPAAGEVFRNVEISRTADPDGFTRVSAIITADSRGRVDVAWQHSDLTEGKLPIAAYDLEYQERVGFWAAVKEHIAQLNAGDFPPECIEYDF